MQDGGLSDCPAVNSSDYPPELKGYAMTEIALDAKRLEYPNYFKWFDGDLSTLFDAPSSLVNGLNYLNKETDLHSTLNYFGTSSKFYINGLLDIIPPEITVDTYPLFERIVQHWSVTGEYCITIENNVVNAIRPDYVFPIRQPENMDIIKGFYFIFPIKDKPQRARVIEYDIASGRAYQTERVIMGNRLQEKYGGTPVNIQNVLYQDTGAGFYRDIKGMVRELNVRFALIQLALNSTSIPLLQVATEGIGGGELNADGLSPTKVAQLGKTGLGLVIPPPFSGEEGARYVERAGTGLVESMQYIRTILGSLSVMSGVPEFVHGLSLSELSNMSSKAIDQVDLLGKSRIKRMRYALTNTFRELGIELTFPEPDVEVENNA